MTATVLPTKKVQIVVPHSMARSALFRVADKRELRPYLKVKIIESFSNEVITFSGEELRQDDADVFYYITSNRDMATGICLFRPVDLIKAVGWSNNTQSRERLAACLVRLNQASLTVRREYGKQFDVMGTNLVVAFAYTSDLVGHWRADIHQFMSELLPQGYSKQSLAVRATLTPFCKWLYSFLASHNGQVTITVDDLFAYSGSAVATDKNKRIKAQQAGEQLVAAGILKSFDIEPRTRRVSYAFQGKNSA
jgi:hypothetical protein